MMSREVLGETRTRVETDHALIGSDSHVVSALFGWERTQGVVLVSPAMGRERRPGFLQYLAYTTDESLTRSAGLPGAGVQRLVYVLDGKVTLDDRTLGADHFAWLPPDASYELRGDGDGRLLVFEKPYVKLPGVETPAIITGAAAEAPREPFMGDPDAVLATLLPTHAGFDMAVNVFTYQPGAALPFVETHVMEHGLYMSQGAGVYRLNERWYPVQSGDAIWMAAYCPQWFVAMGKQPTTYIYYKDVNRDVLLT